jgi:hypothetical protein
VIGLVGFAVALLVAPLAWIGFALTTGVDPATVSTPLGAYDC